VPHLSDGFNVANVRDRAKRDLLSSTSPHKIHDQLEPKGTRQAGKKTAAKRQPLCHRLDLSPLLLTEAPKNSKAQKPQQTRMSSPKTPKTRTTKSTTNPK
jgi:hypothetical protein